MIVKPFAAVRPTASVADQVAALPYDVYDRAEAVAAVDGEPLSFLNIDHPKHNFRLMSICMRPRCMRKLASSSTLAAPMAHSSPSLRRVSICMSSR